MKKIIFLLFLIAIISACTKEPKVIDPIYDNSLNQTQLETAKKAYAIFCDVCKPLMSEYTDDIEWIKIKKEADRSTSTYNNGCLTYQCRDYGWDQQYEIQVKIKDNPTIIPGDLYAWAHIIHYELGGPKNPGITIDKIPQLCGRERVTSKDVYISEPKLSFINN